VDVFAIIHYRLEQKLGFEFQFQTRSRKNSTSWLLELGFYPCCCCCCCLSCGSSKRL